MIRKQYAKFRMAGYEKRSRYWMITVIVVLLLIMLDVIFHRVMSPPFFIGGILIGLGIVVSCIWKYVDQKTKEIEREIKKDVVEHFRNNQ